MYLRPWFIPMKNKQRKTDLSVICTFSTERPCDNAPYRQEKHLLKEAY